MVRMQLSAVRINITQTVAEALKPLDLFAMRDLLWIFNKAPVCVPCLVNIGLQGIFAVTLPGLLVSPNCKVKKIHFPNFVATEIAS